jgi:hypothetical protein
MMALARLAALAILLVLAGGVAASADASHDGSWRIGPYQVVLDRVADDGKPDRLRILRDGRVVFAQRDFSLLVSPGHLFARHGGDAPSQLGRDILGVGQPVLAIESFSGGAHCCYAVTLVVLGQQARALPAIDGADFGVAFVRLPGERALGAHVWDAAFDYYRIYFAAAQPPEVTLRFDRQAMRYEATPDPMRRPAPLPAALDKAIAASRDDWPDNPDDKEWVSPTLLRIVTGLIYTGHLDLAHDVTRRAWPPDHGDAEDFWRDLTECQLRRSAYWPAVAALNSLPALKPAPGCPAP